MSAALASTQAVSLVGLGGVIVHVQTHIGPGIVGTTLVGLPDASLREAKERVRAALFSCGIGGVNQRVTVNLTPADLPKTGSGFDLAIAVSMLAAREIVNRRAVQDVVFYAELGLDGRVLPVPGVLPAVSAALDAGVARVVVAVENAQEAQLVQGIQVVPCVHLSDLVMGLHAQMPSIKEGWEQIANVAALASPQAEGSGDEFEETRGPDPLDLLDVRGLTEAKQALAIAAVGGHHLLLHGPPGGGKSMLAKRLVTILPDLTSDEARSVTALESLVKSGRRIAALHTRPPLQEPHHSATLVSLIGGGNPVRPGAVSLAHAGVLLLDEAPEFNQRTLDALRQPLEQGTVTVHRARSQTTFPARFQLVMTANPCPCGNATTVGEAVCRCTPHRIANYRSRLSGPLLDRVDLQFHVDVPSRADLLAPPTQSSAKFRELVTVARERSRHRLASTPWTTNSQVPGEFLRSQSLGTTGQARTLERLVERGILSLRGADRVARMAWSSADLEGRSVPSAQDYELAMRLRGITEGVPSWV